MINQVVNQGQYVMQPNQFQTVLAIDFFNHDTKNTDTCFGVEPNYNTLFRFKNTVDNFYLKHLQ